MTPEEEAAWRSRLEEIGVSQVAEAIRAGELWGEDRTQVARRWLSEKERRKEASISEQMEVARSAKNAAWTAAIAAIIAAIVAIAAAVISFLHL